MLDDGIYGLFFPLFLKLWTYDVFSPKQSDHMIKCCIAGPTCDGTDVIYKQISLPDMEIGDILVSWNIGAYSWNLATNFNSIPLPKFIKLE